MKRLFLLALVLLLLSACASVPQSGDCTSRNTWEQQPDGSVIIHVYPTNCAPGTATQTGTLALTPTQVAATATALPATPTQTSTIVPTPTPILVFPPTLPNLLKNGGFELPYNYMQLPDNQIHLVPDGWTPFYCDGCPAERWGSGNPYGLLTGRPEYKSASNGGTAGREWRQGATAAQWFCFFRVCRAGLYQQVTVVPGATCEAVFWVRTWSSYDDDTESETTTQDDRDNSTWYIKIDRYGGTDARLLRVVSSRAFGYQDGHYDNWAKISFLVRVPSDSTRITVFIENDRLWPIRQNDSYVDSAHLRCQ